MRRTLLWLLAGCPLILLWPSALAGASTASPRVTSPLPGGTVKAMYVGAAAASVTVQVNRRNYLFLVDTGASTSAVTGKAATALGLVPSGPVQQVATIGCRTSLRSAEISGWRVGAVTLPATRIGIINNALSRERIHGVPVSGLLGSDVLSQFGAVRFDLVANQLVLGARVANAQAGIPLRVLRNRDGVAEIVQATIARHATSFVVDTGSPLTLLQASTASRLGLRSLPGSIKLSGAAGCALTAHITQIIQWTAGGQPLPSTPALTVRASGIKVSAKGPPVGLMGAGTLFGFGRLTIDFTAGRLILGSPVSGRRSRAALSSLLRLPVAPLAPSGRPAS